jgi:hypothetical protein
LKATPVTAGNHQDFDPRMLRPATLHEEFCTNWAADEVRYKQGGGLIGFIENFQRFGSVLEDPGEVTRPVQYKPIQFA